MSAHQHLWSAKGHAASVQTYARIAGVLFLVSLVAGGFGEGYVPSTLIVAGNATATAHNIIASDLLFRLGFLGWLIEAVCDVALTLVLYVLLRPVSANLALGAVFFRLMATAMYAVGELFYFSPSFILGGGGYLSTFSSEQLHALALLSLSVYGFAGSISTVFHGVASLLLGYLMFRSGYLPKILGILWTLGGLGFVIRTLAELLLPAYASPFLLIPTPLAMLALALWLLVRGVDAVKWSENEAVAASTREPS